MDIISTFVGMIIEYSVRPIGKQLGYIISYKSSTAILKDKFTKLLEMKEAVEQSVNGAERNQEVASTVVKTWQTNVEKKIEEVGKFLQEAEVQANRIMCLYGWCPNLKLCYSLGKKAQKKTRAIDELLKECENEKYVRPYNKLTVPPLEVIISSTGLYEDFDSRNSTIRNILEALRNDEMNIIALCGMGGIGKTEMAKEIARRVEGTNNIFKKVAFAVVSKNPDPKEVQDKLAKQLGPSKLDEDKAKKVLVILDDVWGSFGLQHLADIGVYNAVIKKKCKILLTSRSEETCNQLRTNKIFSIGILSEKEAWNLFKDMAGDCINNDTPNDLIP